MTRDCFDFTIINSPQNKSYEQSRYHKQSARDSLKKGQEVSIAGLGIFSAKMREARTARNPRTGESIEVPAMRVPKFRAAKGLKDAVK